MDQKSREETAAKLQCLLDELHKMSKSASRILNVVEKFTTRLDDAGSKFVELLKEEAWSSTRQVDEYVDRVSRVIKKLILGIHVESAESLNQKYKDSVKAVRAIDELLRQLVGLASTILQVWSKIEGKEEEKPRDFSQGNHQN